MSDPAYPAARLVASKVQEHFRRHIAAAHSGGRDHLAPEPDLAAIESMIDSAFWASLRREEGRTPQISLAFVPPDQAGHPLMFETRLPLRPPALTKLAPAVERPGIHLGVWRDDDGDLCVWGTTRTLPAFCLVVEVVTSGLVVVKDRNEPFGKFVNVALLEGDQVKFIDEGQAFEADCPSPIRSLLGFTQRQDGGGVNVLVQIATSIRAHGRGGALLVVPSGSTEWQESIVGPVLYAVQPPFRELADLVVMKPAPDDFAEWQEEMRRAIDAIAGLTAVDGATIMTDKYEVVAFGAKIRRRLENAHVDRVVMTEPVEGSAATIATPAGLGGTRHLSAAQFVHDQRDAIALVASQDGKFTIFQWSKDDDMVHGHRVEALLL
jgi:hypothetical protein